VQKPSLKSYDFELEEEKDFGRLVTFWFGTFIMLFCATGHVFLHENT